MCVRVRACKRERTRRQIGVHIAVARVRLYGSRPRVRCTDSIIDQQPCGSLKRHDIYKHRSVRFALSAAREKRKRDVRHACLPAKISASRRNGIARVQCQCYSFLFSLFFAEGGLQVVTTVRHVCADRIAKTGFLDIILSEKRARDV